jgi:hypothetical protein
VLQSGSLAQNDAFRKPVKTSASAVVLQTPAASQTVTGTIQLTLSGNLSSVYHVDYKIGNYRFASSATSPFSVSWNSALASDGNVQIETIAYDPFGNILSDTFTPVVLLNYGDKASVTGGLPAQASGSLTYALQGYDSVHYPAYWTTFIDGEAQTPLYTDQAAKNQNTVTQTIDTTMYPNGTHEFYFTFHSNDYNNPKPPGGPEDFRGMVAQQINFQNGQTFMDVIANYLHVYTTVGARLALGCTRTYTNGATSACTGPQWVPNDATVVSIDSSGNLTGLAIGYTDVTLTEGGKSTVIHVWVTNNAGLPHFTTNGGLSTTYESGQSTFFVAPFLLDPSHLQADSNLVTEVNRAGINALTTGIYLNPTDLTTTYTAWQSSFTQQILPGLQWAAANGFHVVGTGDNVARNIGQEAYRSINWPPAKQAITYAFQQFAQSGTAISCEMIDEAGLLWGYSPTPPGLLGAANSMQSIACTGSTCTVTWPNLSVANYHDTISNGLTFSISGNTALNSPAGTTYTVQNATASTFTFTPSAKFATATTFTPQSNPTTEFEWFARATTCSGAPCVPMMLDNSLSTLTSWAKGATPTVPISYPPGGIVLPESQRNWLGTGSLSDYASHYWDTGQLRPTYVFGKGVRESNYWMLNAYYIRQPYMQLNRPQIMEIGTSGPSYVKESPAGTGIYNPPLDQLQTTGDIAKSVGSTMFSAVAAGAAGLRPYNFETSDAYTGELNAGPGSGVSLGANPFYGMVNLWQSMAYASALLTKVLQPYVLGVPMNSPALGRNIITGVRKGSTGTMLIVVNGWDGARTLNINFTPYKSGFGAVRYVVSDTGIVVTAEVDAAGESVTLNGGDSLIYIFPNSNASNGLDNVTFLPISPVSGNRLAVTVGYLYSQNLIPFGSAVDCTSGCTIPVDRRIGDVFFQYTFLSTAASSIRRSTVQPLGAENSVKLPLLK